MKVQPRSRRPGLRGLMADGSALVLAVAEPPAEGQANRAVCLALAGSLGCAAGAVQVTRGATARLKTIRVAGDPAALSARLEALTA